MRRASPPAEHVPARGDAVWISLNPQAGHEQAGRRPALVLSPRAYNDRVGLVIVGTIIWQVKGYPVEVCIPGGETVSGVVLSDQVKSLDWRARQAELTARLPETVVANVPERLSALLT